MVTLQILVLSFQVRVLVSQQKGLTINELRDVFSVIFPQDNKRHLANRFFVDT